MRKILFTIGALLCLCIGLQAQTRTLSGKILSSSDNKPVSGATIALKGGRPVAAAAGVDGSFSLAVPAGGHFTLRISAIGYESREISSADITGDQLTVTLKESAKGLNEVVVVGYGSTKKKDLTGSVGVVPLANTDKAPVTGTAQLLEGTVSGVQVTQTNAQPGSSFMAPRAISSTRWSRSVPVSCVWKATAAGTSSGSSSTSRSKPASA